MNTTCLSVGLGLVAILSAPSSPAQKATDSRVNTGPAGTSASQSHVIAASGSSVYVAWQDDRDDPGSGVTGIYFNRSLDGGATWMAADRRLGTGWAPQIAASGSSVYVIWMKDDVWGYDVYTDVYFNRSVDGGTTWLASELDLPWAAGGRDPWGARIQASGSSVFVTWEAVVTVLSGLIHPTSFDVGCVFFTRSTDGGTTWVGERLLNPVRAGYWGSQSQMAVLGSSLYVTWADSRFRSDIRFMGSSDGGATWTEARLDTDPARAASSSNPQIAASGSSVYAAWRDSRNGADDIYFNRSSDGGATWLTSDLQLNTGTGGDPAIAVSGSSVFVTWQDAAGDFYLNRSWDAGATWLPSDLRLNTDPAGAAERSDLQLAASGSSVYVTWRDTRNGTGDIYFNRSLDGGTTWLTSDVRMNRDPEGTAEQTRPQIAASESSVYITWEDARNSTQAGAGDIYFNIPFGSMPYGTGKEGSGGFVPQLEGNDDLHPGSTLSLTVSGGPGGAAGIFAFGFANSQVSIPVVGGTLLVNPAVMLPFALGGTQDVPGDGVFVLDIPIPADINLLGVNLNAQVGLLDPGATSGISLSNAVEAWIH